MVATVVTAKVSNRSGRHAGAIADIIADIVGNVAGLRGRLRNSGLDLAHHVATDIAPLVKMPPPRRRRWIQRGAEAQTDQTVDDDALSSERRIEMQAVGEEGVVPATASRPKPTTQHCGDGRRRGRRPTGRRPAGTRGFGGPHIGATETYIRHNRPRPTKRADQEAKATCQPRKKASAKITTPTMAMVVYWRLR